MLFRKLSFNAWLFLSLAFQYALMHLLSYDEPVTITILEFAIFIVYTVVELSGFLYRRRRTGSESISGMVLFFFAVIWTVALFSQFQMDTYPGELTIINSLGM